MGLVAGIKRHRLTYYFASPRRFRREALAGRFNSEPKSYTDPILFLFCQWPLGPGDLEPAPPIRFPFGCALATAANALRCASDSSRRLASSRFS